MSKKEVEQEQESIISLVGGTTKWNWDEESIFIGRPTNNVRYITDEEGNTRKDENGRDMCLGHEFEDESGELYTLGDTYHINSAMKITLSKETHGDKVGDNDGKSIAEIKPLMKIEYLGKTESNGRRLNQFKIDIVKF